jgi:2-methylcitrate dehydratase PrpD
MAQLACDFAARHLGSDATNAVPLMLDGRRASAPGAAFAGAATIDSFDAHDGHALTKGHAGAAVLPAVLAFHALRPPTGEDNGKGGHALLADLAVGYEAALRAGIALHATAADYHTSGAWNALGCALVGARRLGLAPEATRHALGIAEYHGPRSLMMRCIDHPTMVKDGSAWGALAGASAALLAAAGFTGAPAALVEAPEVAHLWADLGARWRFLELYFKPQPVCRWAQPAAEAALELARVHRLKPQDIAAIEVETFAAASRLMLRHPRTTEEAQYSLPHPVAAALVRGAVGPAEVDAAAFADPEIRRLADAVAITVAPELDARFPAERWARVRLRLRHQDSVCAEATARGDPEAPLAEAELAAKFDGLCAAGGIAPERHERIRVAIQALRDDAPVSSLIEELARAPAR